MSELRFRSNLDARLASATASLLALALLATSVPASADSGACMPTVPEDPSAPGTHPGVGPIDREEATPGYLGERLPGLLDALRESEQSTNGLPIGVGTGNRICFPDSVPRLEPIETDD